MYVRFLTQIEEVNIKSKPVSQFQKYKISLPAKGFSRKILDFFFKSWWTFLFIIICFLAYKNAIEKRNEEKIALQKKVEELNKEKAKALALKEDLESQIESQNDAAWIELTLLKGLGLVPEGYTKVFFVEKKKR